jgi:hypothetical protein
MMDTKEPIDVLEEIVKRNSGPDEEIDLRGNEIDGYFYFDRIGNSDDLEAAWAVFTNSDEIRRRLTELDDATDISEGMGYRCRSRYWIKDEDFDSGIVYVSPPPIA